MLAILLLSLTALDTKITGLATFEINSQSLQTINIDQNFNTSNTIQLNITSVNSLMLSGSFYSNGNGTARVYTQDTNGTQLLIFDSAALSNQDTSFNNICIDTCNSIIQDSTLLVIVRGENTSLTIYNITYSASIQPDTINTTPIPNINLTNTTTLNLSQYFIETNNASLTFSAQIPDAVRSVLLDDLLFLSARDSGQFNATITSSNTISNASISFLIFVNQNNVTNSALPVATTDFSAQLSNNDLQFGVSTLPQACGTLNESLTLTQNIGSGLLSVCFDLNTSGIMLDCAGFSIIGNGTGIGINISVVNGVKLYNITIQNCNIQNVSIGINITSANETMLINNSITNVTVGIYLNNTALSVLENNTVLTVLDSLYLINSSNNTFNNNNFNASGTNGKGIELVKSFKNVFKNNNGTSSGTGTGRGIDLSGSSKNNFFIGNKGDSRTSNAISFAGTSTNNTLTNNLFLAASNNALFFSSAENNTLINNTGKGTNARGIRIDTNSNNLILLNNTFEGRQGALVLTSKNITFTNTTVIGNVGFEINSTNDIFVINTSFQNTNWSVRTALWTNISLIDNERMTNYSFNNTARLTITKTGAATIDFFNVINANGTNLSVDVNLSINRTHVNSSISPGLNVSANITLFGLSFTTPNIIVDFEDDGTFETCNFVPGNCTTLSYSGGTFIFNVSSFSTYAVNETFVPPPSSACGVVNASLTLVNNVNTSGGTCFDFNASNIVLDCDGYNISSNPQGNIAINLTSNQLFDISNVTVQNCGISNFSIGLQLNGSTNVSVLNLVITNIDRAFEVNSSNNITIQNITFTDVNWSIKASKSNLSLIDNSRMTNYSFANISSLVVTNTGMASVNFFNLINANGTNLSMDVNLSTNFTLINSSRSPGLNVTANITFFGLNNLANPQPIVDYDGDGGFEPCNATRGCTELGFSGGTFVFNVSSFSAYAVNETTPVIFVDPSTTTNCSQKYNITSRTCAATVTGVESTLNFINASNAAIPGMTIYIRRANYSRTLRPIKSGAFGMPITYAAYNGEAVFINKTLNPPSSEYALAPDEAINGDDSPVDLYVYGINYTVIDGISFWSNDGWARIKGSSNITIKNSHFWNATAAGAAGGIKIINSSYVRLINNTVDLGNDMTYIISSNYTILENNTYTQSRHTLFSILCGSFNIIRNNYFNNTIQKIGEVLDCEGAPADSPALSNSSKYNLIENNTFAHTRTSINNFDYNGLQYAAQNGVIRRNVFFNNLGGAIGFQLYADEAQNSIRNRIYHNVFYKNMHGGVWMANNYSGALMEGNTFKNNIFYQNNATAGSNPIQINLSRLERFIFEKNNIFNNSAGQNVIAYNRTAQTIVNVQTNNPTLFINNSEVEPLFNNTVDFARLDFSLNATSPLIDNGTALTVTNETASGTVMNVSDVTYFFDGFGISGEQGDIIQLIGDTKKVKIISINYATNSLTLNESLTWTKGQGVSLAYTGNGPDIGAFESPFTISATSTCGIVNASGITLTSNVIDTDGGACFDFNESGGTLNCAGFNITANPFAVIGINITPTANTLKLGNITIKNCNIFNFSVGINVSFAVNISLFSNNVTNLTDGIWLNNTARSILENNSANASAGRGIALINSSNNTIILNNIYSRDLQSALYLEASKNDLIQNNTLKGNTGNGLMLYLNSNNNIITNNIGTSNNEAGAQASSSSNNVFNNNTFSSAAYAATFIHTNSNNNNFTNNTLIGNTAFEINASDNILITNSSFQNTNYSIKTALGSNISLIDNQRMTNYSFNNSPKLTITITGSASVDFFNVINANGTNLSVDVNLSINKTHVNSSRSPGLNVTANITLFGLSFTTPNIIVDFEDDGTFETCNFVPRNCTNLSYSGGTFIFNVSSFSTYAVNELVLPHCGNGNINFDANETCDDNNTISGDGCSSLCVVEAGWWCRDAPSNCSSLSWAAPIGIPPPPFGIGENHTMYAGLNFSYAGSIRPYNSTNNGPYTHYIDINSSSCTDTNNAFGTQEVPRCSLPTGSTIPAGSIVEVHGGAYLSAIYTITSNGTPGYPIFIRGPNSSSKPIMERTIRVRGKYIIIENINFNKNNRSEAAVDIRPAAGDPLVNHVAVRYSESSNYAKGDGTNAMLLGQTGIGDNVTSYIIHYNNTIHADNSINPLEAYERDVNGIAIDSDTDHVWVLDNHIFNLSGDAVGSGHGANYTATNYYIGRNIMHDTDENAIDIKEVVNLTASQNKMYNFYGASSGDTGSATVAHYGPDLGPRNIWYLFNEIYNSSDNGIQIGGGSVTNPDEIYVVGNVIYSNLRGIQSFGSDRIYIVGNTIYNNTNNAIDLDGTSENASADINNNIFSSIKNSSNFIVRVDQTNYQNNSTIERNLFFDDNNNINISWTTVYKNLSSFQTATNKCVTCIQGDPLFSSTALKNFSLTSTSPAIDAGNLSDAYAKFQSRFGINISVDFNNVTRPRDGDSNGSAGWDIGAFEHVPSSCTIIDESEIIYNNVNLSGDSCFGINKSNIIFDCEGFNISGHNSHNGVGFNISSSENLNLSNVTIQNCRIMNVGTGITVNQTNHINLVNTSFINVDTAFEINGSSNITINNATFQNVNWSIKTAAGANVSLIDNEGMTNYSFNNTPRLTVTRTGIASVNFFNIINANGTNLSIDINLTTNRVHVNTSRSRGLNVTANITLFNVAHSNILFGIQADHADTDTFTSCAPDCTILDTSNNNLIFNVSSFTTYRLVNACGIVNESITLNSNVVASASNCFDVNNSNIIIDCVGYNISANPFGQVGINVTISAGNLPKNITVMNCNIQNFSIGINISSAVNISLFNNNISNVTDGIWINNTATSVLENNTANATTGFGLYLANSTNNTVNNGNFSNNKNNLYGIYLLSSQNNLLNNNVGTSSGRGNGIRISTNSNNNVLINNTGRVETNGNGILLTASSNNTISRSVGRAGNLGYGIRVDTGSNNNTLINNTFVSTTGIFVLTSSNNNATSNTIIADTGFEINGSTGILITNTSFQDVNWSIKTALGSNVSLIDNERITNYTFANSPSLTITKTGMASINFFNIINANGTNFSIAVNLTQNRTFVNSSNSNGFNVTANITLFGISLTTPAIFADFIDTGTFAQCTSPTCEQLSYSANTFIFNVSHFTTFAVNEQPTTPPQPQPLSQVSGGSNSGGKIRIIPKVKIENITSPIIETPTQIMPAIKPAEKENSTKNIAKNIIVAKPIIVTKKLIREPNKIGVLQEKQLNLCKLAPILSYSLIGILLINSFAYLILQNNKHNKRLKIANCVLFLTAGFATILNNVLCSSKLTLPFFILLGILSLFAINYTIPIIIKHKLPIFSSLSNAKNSNAATSRYKNLLGKINRIKIELNEFSDEFKVKKHELRNKTPVTINKKNSGLHNIVRSMKSSIEKISASINSVNVIKHPIKKEKITHKRLIYNKQKLKSKKKVN